MAEDFVDITPPMLGKKNGGQGVVFQDTEWYQINENPRGLTREGIEKSIELWKKSSNGHVVIKFKTMLANCKKIAESGKTKAGLIIYARSEDGAASWVENASIKKKEQELEETKVKPKKQV